MSKRGPVTITEAELRSVLANHVRAKNSALGDPARQSQFHKGLEQGLTYIAQAKDKEERRNGERVSLLNRAEALRTAAQELLHNIEKLSVDELEDCPSQCELFEGKIGGTGLLSVTHEACSKIIERADIVKVTFAAHQGGQMRRSDIMGVKIISNAWRESFKLEPSAKGAFGSVLNILFQTLGWKEVAPNTLAKWLSDSQ